MAADFSKLLNKPLTSAEPPKPLPIGHYLGRVAKYDLKEVGKNNIAIAEFTFSFESAKEDVEEADLAGIDLSRKTLRKSFFLDDDSLWRLRKFVESCKVEADTFEEALHLTVQCPVEMYVNQKPSSDGESFYNEITEVKGAE